MDNRFRHTISFDVEDAGLYGIEGAILLYDFRDRERRGLVGLPPHDTKGVFYSPQIVAASFPFWTYGHFLTVLFTLVDLGVMDTASRAPAGHLAFLLDDPPPPAPREEPPPPASGPAPAPAPREKPGYVYLIRSQDGYYKIGKSADPTTRIRAMGVILPFEIETLHLIYSRDYHRTERYLQDKFAQARVRGEWFRLTEADVAWIQSLTEL